MGACGYVAVEDPWEGLRRFMRRDFELQASDRGLREFVLDRADSTELGRRSRERIQPLVAELVEPARAGTKTCPPWYQPRS